MAWILLIIAGLLEIVWAFTMKLSQGFTRSGASIVTLLAMLASFGLLSASMRTLPLGTAYTIWNRNRCGGHVPRWHHRPE